MSRVRWTRDGPPRGCCRRVGARYSGYATGSGAGLERSGGVGLGAGGFGRGGATDGAGGAGAATGGGGGAGAGGTGRGGGAGRGGGGAGSGGVGAGGLGGVGLGGVGFGGVGFGGVGFGGVGLGGVGFGGVGFGGVGLGGVGLGGFGGLHRAPLPAYAVADPPGPVDAYAQASAGATAEPAGAATSRESVSSANTRVAGARRPLGDPGTTQSMGAGATRRGRR
ncbi:hypothetical protein ABZ626_27715 [Streptomyces longispororuber]|uniref:hypothetical protein n=1 Tax=Streptomyces longispororuber TaxID=68230 RepID=UPI0033F55C2C